MMDNSENEAFRTDLRDGWARAWPLLGDELDSLLLVAFRVLVMYLDRHRYFRQPSSFTEVRVKTSLSSQLMTLLRTNDAIYVEAFASLLTAVLDSTNLDRAAGLAFAIDLEFGPKLSRCLANNKRTGLQNVARAVNNANCVLIEHFPVDKPVILVRSPRYWSTHKQVVPEFPLPPQGTATNFRHLLPTSTLLKRVHYSALGGGLKERLVVSLWPVKAPTIKSRAISKSRKKNRRVYFYFKGWDNLPKTHQNQQRIFANRLAEYIRNDGIDVFNTVHIVAAPELTLAPESIESITSALATRRNATWIVFPGTYHVKKGTGIINQSPLYVGGVLHPNDLAGDRLYADKAAVKTYPVVFQYPGRDFEEHIDGRESFTHLLDTSVGRIAVMICFDFLDTDLRNEVVKMCVDHLFILAMSPGTKKFEIEMESVSSFQTGCFLVNAFSDEKRRAPHRAPLRAAHRAPLKNTGIRRMSPFNKRKHYRVILKPE